MPVKSDELPPVVPVETFYGVYVGRREGCVFFLVTETRHGFGTRMISQSTWKARCELSSDAARVAADNFVEANGLKEGKTPCRLAEAGKVLKAQTGHTEIGLRKWAADMASLGKRTCECARARRKEI
ncbi:hypothetical protein RvY_02500-1 [Ramazzottius varieornatus]|uniref:Uncharacterized protein n=1 Tax=Ramazzottius varieornatus TaxID=947166 RepID=A0A1D1UNB6_RAMVA|nr:hypothetical protein RvY_02500-1 [Ramazzottius varieornatus]